MTSLLSYTNLTIFAISFVVILDLFILKTKLLLTKRFYYFLLVVAIWQTIVDNYLNGRWFMNEAIVGPYNPAFFSGIKIWHTPLENYFFGFALVIFNVSIFEWLTKKPKSH
jgi:lycopene cyclase domain-containing protein